MKWIKVEESLPTKDTRYAGDYGVSVLCFNANDPEDYRPMSLLYKFKDNLFFDVASGFSDPIYGDWFPMEVTHWMEYPERP